MGKIIQTIIIGTPKLNL